MRAIYSLDMFKITDEIRCHGLGCRSDSSIGRAFEIIAKACEFEPRTVHLCTRLEKLLLMVFSSSTEFNRVSSTSCNSNDKSNSNDSKNGLFNRIPHFKMSYLQNNFYWCFSPASVWMCCISTAPPFKRWLSPTTHLAHFRSCALPLFLSHGVFNKRHFSGSKESQLEDLLLC